MSEARELYFKIERLDSNDNFIEEKTPKLVDGAVNVEYDDVNRRTCSFTLLEPLPTQWMSSRWKLYYGLKISGEVYYEPLGVFIPINPQEDEQTTGYTTRYQGIDKAQLLVDEYSDIPITYPAGTTLKEVASDIFFRINETKLNLEDVPYELATEFTFEEETPLEHILSTLVRSFAADWYYDRDGYAVLEQLPPATQRPIVRDFDDDDLNILIDSSKDIDTDKYWNKVVVIGGTVDTDIFRQTLGSDIHKGIAGRWVTRFFREDAAASQDQVNELAQQFLDAGTRLPASIIIRNLPIPDLEPKQIIRKGGSTYEIINFNIPLNLDTQTIQAGEVL